ncbi:MAG TPA: hypothetical protein VG736_06075 [Vicinamibacterales bacterium]|nr:hypothetical protein [Vicinamibacterales bacterium]
MSRLLSTAGRVSFAIGIAAFGVIQIAAGDFVTRAVPHWPVWMPARIVWVWIVGLLLVESGSALAFNVRARLVGGLLGLALASSFVLLALPIAATDTWLGGLWTNAGKALALSGGAFLIVGGATGDRVPKPFESIAVRARRWSVGPWCFAAFLVLCGIQHFIYVSFVASLIPSWIPGATFWVSVAGVALIAGGVGVTIRRTRWLAGVLSGTMIFSWVFLVHIPRALASPPGTTNETVAVFEALAMSGIGWLIAASASPR